MAKLELVKGTTSYRAYVFIQDSSVSTGVGLTGLVFNSASLVASYVRPGAARTAITLVTQTVTGAYSSGGFVEVDATNTPGLYRLDVPDAALASGVNAVVVMLKGATNMAPCVFEIELTAVDNQDAVRMALTALPNAAAEAAGGLYTRGSGAGQITQPSNGLISTNATQFAGQTITAAAGVTLPSSVASPTNITAGVITTVTNLTNAPTSGDLTATMKTSVTTAATAATPVAASVTAGVTVTTNNDKTGYGLSAAAVQAIWDALTSALTTVGSIGKRISDNLDATVSTRSTYAGGDTSGVTTLLARLTSARAGFLDFLTGDAFARLGAPVGASISADIAAVEANAVAIAGYVDTEVAAIKAKTDNLPAAPAAVGDIPTATQNADALLNRDMSAVTVTNARSPINALRFLRNKFSISGTTLTVTKEDDTTSAWTSTLTTSASADPVTGSDPT